MSSFWCDHSCVDLPISSTSRRSAGSHISTVRAPGDLKFRTSLRIRGAQIGTVYAVHYNSNNALITSGTFSVDPTTFSPADAYSESDGVTMYGMKFGYKWKDAGGLLTRGSTLLYLSQVANTYLAETNTTTIAAWENDIITVDKPSKVVTINNATPQQIYDFFQYWQSLPANADTLSGGEIYAVETVDSVGTPVSFEARADWSFVQSNTNIVHFAISTIDRTGSYVGGENGLAKYEKSFSSIEEMVNDVNWGDDLITLNKNYKYHFFNDSGAGFQVYERVRSSFGQVLIPVNDFTVDSTHFVELVAERSSRITKDFNKGVELVLGVESSSGINLGLYNKLTGLRIRGDTYGGTNKLISNSGGNIIDGCILYSLAGFAYLVLPSNSITIQNSILYGQSVQRATINPDFGYIKLINNVLNVPTGTALTLFHDQPQTEIRNNVFYNCGTDISGTLSGGASNNATSKSVFNYGSSNVLDITSGSFVDVLNNDYHLVATAESLKGVGADVSAIGVTNDIDGNPWLDDLGAPYYNIGPDMLGDAIFASYLNLSSTQTGGAYAIENKDHALVTSSVLNTVPTLLGTPLIASSLADEVFAYYLKFGYKYKSSTFVLTEGSTLIFLANEVNAFISELNTVTLASYAPAKLTVNKATKVITRDVNTTAEEIYDYMQYWQSLDANADTLKDGEIYEAYDNAGVTNYRLLAGWAIVQTGVSGVVYIAIDKDANVTAGDYVPGSNNLLTYAKVYTGATAIDDWWADTGPGGYGPRDISATGEDFNLVVEVFKPADNSPYDVTNRISLTDTAWNSNLSRYVTLKAAAGHEHQGKPNTGARLHRNLQNIFSTHTVFVADFNRVEGLEITSIYGGNNSSGTTGALCVHNEGAAYRIIAKSSVYGHAISVPSNGGQGSAPVVISCLAYDSPWDGFHLYGYTEQAILHNCVSLNNIRYGFGAQTNSRRNRLYNCIAMGNATDFSTALNNSSFPAIIESCASSDASLSNIPVANNSLINQPLTHLNSVGSGDPHLTTAGAVAFSGTGFDNSALLSALGYAKDIDGQPFLSPSSIGVDQVGNVLFVAYPALLSIPTGVVYAIQDNQGAIYATGILNSTKLSFSDPILVESETDSGNTFHLKFGSKYKASAFPLVDGESLAFLSNEPQANITEAVQATVDAYPGIVIDKANKKVTFQSATTQAQAYDFLQSYQSKLANTDLLPAGEIFSTVLGNTFNLLPDWTFVFDVAPSGAWNVTGGKIIFSFAGGSITDFGYDSILYFDSDSDNSVFTFSNSNIVTVEVVSGYAGVGGIQITPSGTTPTGIVNNSPLSITINSPAKLLTINVNDSFGSPLTGYEWRLYEDDLTPGVLGVIELDGEESALSAQQTYNWTTPKTIVFQIIDANHEEYLETISLGATDITRNITLQAEDNT